MQPLDQQQRQSILDAAAKAFAGQSADELATELREFESLLFARFNQESGLSSDQESRLNDLADKFKPFIK